MPAQSASRALKKFCAQPAHTKSTLGDFIKNLGPSSFALIIFIFSLVMSGPWPLPPGMSAVIGLPILFISLQLVWGNESIWLPKKLANHPISEKRIKKIIGKLLPTLHWLEKLLQVRCTFLFTKTGLRIIGAFIAVMALIMSLPIPGGNFLPGLTISLLALAILQRDGVLAILSLLFACTVFLIMYQLMSTGLGTLSDWLDL